MNFAEMSQQLDELYSNMTVNELRDRLRQAGLVVFEGPFGFVEFGEETFLLEPVQYSTKDTTPHKVKWELNVACSGKVA